MRLVVLFLVALLGLISATKIERLSVLGPAPTPAAAQTEEEEDEEAKRKQSADQVRSQYVMLVEATKKLEDLWEKSNEQVLKIRDEKEESDAHYYTETKDWVNRARRALDEAKATQQKLTNDVLTGRIKIPKTVAKIEATAASEEKKIEKLEKEREEQDPDPKKALAAAKAELEEVAPESSTATENESATEVKLSATKKKFEDMLNNKDIKKNAPKPAAAAATTAAPAATTAAPAATVAAGPVTPAVAAANQAAAQVIAQAEKPVATAAAAAKPAEAKPVIVPNAAAEESKNHAAGTIRLNTDGEVAPLEAPITGGKKLLSKNEMAYRSVTTSDTQNIDPRVHRAVREQIKELGKTAYIRRLSIKEATQDMPKAEK